MAKFASDGTLKMLAYPITPGRIEGHGKHGKGLTADYVLVYVAYALPPLTREERATTAKVEISSHFNIKQQVFLEFVLSHYVNVGVEELDAGKLTPLLRLKYRDSLPDAVADLGEPKEIQAVFISFQKFLYVSAA